MQIVVAVTELHVTDPKAKNKQRVVQDLTKTIVALVNAAKLLLKKEDDLYTNKMYPKNK